MEQQKKIKARKQNMKIYKLYRAVSLDLVFFYAIEILFLSQVKNINIADIVLAKSFYAVFMVFLEIPTSIIVDRIGTKRCTILGNIFNCIFVLLIIFCDNLGMLIFAQLICGICFSLKDVSDAALIHYSIPKTNYESEIFSRLEGKAFKDYYIIDAITAILAGLLYVVNPYIPMIGSIAFTLISIMLSLGFEEMDQKPEKEKISTNKYFKEFSDAVKFIINSQRLRSLFLYSGIAWGTFCLISTYRTSILMDIGTSEQDITIIAAVVGLASSMGSKKQDEFHNHFRNKTLSTVLYMLTFFILVAGLTGIFKLSYGLSIIILVISFIAIGFLQGMHSILNTRYLSNFASKKILTQIYAINSISKNIFRAMIGFLGAYLLKITDTANGFILVGILLLITVIGLTSYMKTRLGLKPEEYDKKEIYEE